MAPFGKAAGLIACEGLDIARNARGAGALALLVLLASAAGCKARGGGAPAAPGSSIPPILAEHGLPAGPVRAKTIDAAGGTVASADGLLSVTIPPGAFAAATEVTVEPVTLTAPGGIGSGYRLRPDGALAAPVTLTFTGPTSYATGTSIDGYGIASQDAAGFWTRATGVTRNAAANTLSVTVQHFSDWAVVWQAGVPGLYGPFTVTQTVGIPFTASGTATLFYQGENATARLYTLTGQAAFGGYTGTAPTCALPASSPAAQPLVPAVATVLLSPVQFRWGVNAAWGATCSDGTIAEHVPVLFDTTGLHLLGCSRGYVGTPTLAADHLAGTYAIDCGVDGAVTATWDFTSCVPGVKCALADPCAVAAISCDTGAPVCTPAGKLYPAGTPCAAGQVCDPAGACVACNDGADCTSAGACLKSAIGCGTGAPVCALTTTPVAGGTSCGANLACDGAGACACVPGADCTPPGACVTSAITCDATGAPVCTASTTPVAPGTACGSGLVCDGAGSCAACAGGSDCTPAGACVTSQILCGTGAPVCTPTATPVLAGTTCGANLACDGAGVCACSPGAACTAPAGACVAWGIACDATGTPVCSPTATPVAAGTSCGANLACDGAGVCACSPGADCTAAGDCVASSITCDLAGAPVCTPGAPLLAGTACGAFASCDGAGACVCAQGTVCAVSNPAAGCTAGTVQCSGTIGTCTADAVACTNAGGLASTCQPDGTCP